MPQPGKSENQQSFIDRCMGDDRMLTEFPDQKQRAAVCYSKWKNRGKKKKK